ncbi:MAG TPA: hypothetical protein VGQ83_00290 [Polyangia bacterium]|jgi:hypothetical protein
MRTAVRLLLTGLMLGAGCGPRPAPPPRPPASRPARAPASAPASAPATQPAIAVWPRERCGGLGPVPAGAAAAAAPLDAAERAALGRAGRILDVARTPVVVVGRGERLELHPRTAPANGRKNGRRNGAADDAPLPPPPPVACDLLGEADLLPERGCERVWVCRGLEAYALVVAAAGRPALAVGEPLRLGAARALLLPAHEAGEQIVWRATEHGRDAEHAMTREAILRPHQGRLRQVFARLLASTVAADEAPAAPASSAASQPQGDAACAATPRLVTCGAARFAWDPARFAYRPVAGPGRRPYQAKERVTALDPVHAMYAALRAGDAVGLAFERRGTSCVEAQHRFELFSGWPKAPGPRGAAAEVARVVAERGRVRFELLPFGEDAPVDVAEDYAYGRELTFLDTLGRFLSPEPAGPPKGREGFRCGEGFGQPIADVALGATLESVEKREKRRERGYKKRCAATKAAGAAPRVRLRCDSRDRVTRIYDFVGGVLVAVAEQYGSDVGERRMERAEERWGERFGAPVRVTAPAPAGSELRWAYRGAVLSAARLADGGTLFLHRRAHAPFALEGAAASAPARR